jgi:hypothetical protein
MNNQQSGPGNTVSVNSSFRFKRQMRMAVVTLSAAGIIGLVMIMGTRFKQDRINITTGVANVKGDSSTSVTSITPATLDTLLYNQKLMHIVNGDSSGRWPVKSAYPKAGAILPFKRIVAYYGNLYSKNMGILGQLPPKQMLERLKAEVKNWQMADTTMEVIPALHYIAITAQGSPGGGGKYRLRMPFHQIDSVLSIAREINAIVFLDLQVGLSTLQEEIPQLQNYLKMPNVHLGIDPEFSMKTGRPPGKVVGTFDASDINYASDYLAKLVKENNIPPKILIVHRFTQGMVTNYKQIRTKPEVQLVMHMDGWGFGAKKVNTYRQFIYREPVQFTGFKIFYRNDTKPNSHLMTPKEVLQLKPQPVYIQYQ